MNAIADSIVATCKATEIKHFRGELFATDSIKGLGLLSGANRFLTAGPIPVAGSDGPPSQWATRGKPAGASGIVARRIESRLEWEYRDAARTEEAIKYGDVCLVFEVDSELGTSYTVGLIC